MREKTLSKDLKYIFYKSVFENVTAKCAVIIFMRPKDGTNPGFFSVRINEIVELEILILVLI
jgi:hypothetical protein